MLNNMVTRVLLVGIGWDRLNALKTEVFEICVMFWWRLDCFDWLTISSIILIVMALAPTSTFKVCNESHDFGDWSTE